MIKIIFQKFKEYLATRKKELQPVRIRAKKIKRRTRLQFWVNLFEAISEWAAEKKERNKEKLYSDEDSDYVNDWFYSSYEKCPPPYPLGKKIEETFDDDAVTFKFQLTEEGQKEINKVMNPSGPWTLSFGRTIEQLEPVVKHTKNVVDDLAESVTTSINGAFMNEPDDSISELIDDTIEKQYQKVISDETIDYIRKETDISVLKMLYEETEDPEIQKIIINRIKEVVNEKKNKRRVQRPKRRASVPLQPQKSAL